MIIKTLILIIISLIIANYGYSQDLSRVPMDQANKVCKLWSNYAIECIKAGYQRNVYACTSTTSAIINKISAQVKSLHSFFRESVLGRCLIVCGLSQLAVSYDSNKVYQECITSVKNYNLNPARYHYGGKLNNLKIELDSLEKEIQGLKNEEKKLNEELPELESKKLELEKIIEEKKKEEAKLRKETDYPTFLINYNKNIIDPLYKLCNDIKKPLYFPSSEETDLMLSTLKRLKKNEFKSLLDLKTKLNCIDFRKWLDEERSDIYNKKHNEYVTLKNDIEKMEREIQSFEIEMKRKRLNNIPDEITKKEARIQQIKEDIAKLEKLIEKYETRKK